MAADGQQQRDGGLGSMAFSGIRKLLPVYRG